MAADLVVRTENIEYTSGDTINGAVYLKISGPTCAYGVKVKFFGYETFMYESKKHATDGDVIHDTQEYLSSDEITLYEFENPIALGQYVFPFQKRLPNELPASTFLKSMSNSAQEWKVEIVYGIEASLMGAKGIQARQTILVTQPDLLTLLDSKSFGEETKTVSLSMWMPLVMTPTTVRIRLDREQYFTGDNLKLKIDIELDGIFKPRIESILFQLIRDLRITFQKSRPKTDGGTLKCGRTLQWPTSQSVNLSTIEQFIPDDILASGFVHPEGPSFVVWSSRLVDVEGTKLINGIKELLIPLKDSQGCNVAPTAVGSHVWLMYSVKVTIKFQRNSPILLQLPVCCVKPKSAEGSNWKPEDWVYDCQVLAPSAKSPCFVTHETLESAAFSTLPSFQVL